MSSPAFFLKVGDRLPPIEAILLDAGGVAVDLTGATVDFVYRKVGETTGVVRTATVVDAQTGKVKYDFVAADTTAAGLLDAEWQVTFTGGKKSTFPNHKHLRLQIISSLD